MLSCGRTLKGYAEKTFKNVIQSGPAPFGNAATRLEAYVVKGGPFVYGSYPDIDALYEQQAVELDHKKREAILHKMQQLLYERTIFAPIWQLAFLNGVGPRVGESAFGRSRRSIWRPRSTPPRWRAITASRPS